MVPSVPMFLCKTRTFVLFIRLLRNILKILELRMKVTGNKQTDILPSANEVWGKVMFLHLPVILFTGVYPSMQRGRHPTQADTPLQYTVNKRAVHILLECILV